MSEDRRKKHNIEQRTNEHPTLTLLNCLSGYVLYLCIAKREKYLKTYNGKMLLRKRLKSYLTGCTFNIEHPMKNNSGTKKSPLFHLIGRTRGEQE